MHTSKQVVATASRETKKNNMRVYSGPCDHYVQPVSYLYTDGRSKFSTCCSSAAINGVTLRYILYSDLRPRSKC